MSPRTRPVRLVAALLGALALGPGAGCATYSDRLAGAHQAVRAGRYAEGVQELDRFLGVDSAEELPRRFGSDEALATLERGTLLQSDGRFALSARDFQAAERDLEVLDLAGDAAGAVGRYVYSDSAAKYRAPPSEKLALNAMNLLNYLARGDLTGARVEARRYTTIRDYLLGIDRRYGRSVLGSYLAGFVFEQLDDPEEALRYYDTAVGRRELPGLAGSLHRLAQRSAFRGDHLAGWLARHPAPSRERRGTGELLVVAAVGRVPMKVPARIPVGAAVGIAGTYVTGDLRVLERSALKVLVYPELASSRSLFHTATASVPGASLQLDLVEDFGALVRSEYELLRPRILGAALSRMIVRAAAAEGARAAGREANSAVGTLAALLVEGALVAVDRPDTRSWTFLPQHVYAGRTRLPAGRHEVRVTLRNGSAEERVVPVDVPSGGFAAVVVTAPR